MLRQRSYEQAEALVFAQSTNIPRACLTEFFSYALHYRFSFLTAVTALPLALPKFFEFMLRPEL